MCIFVCVSVLLSFTLNHVFISKWIFSIHFFLLFKYYLIYFTSWLQLPLPLLPSSLCSPISPLLSAQKRSGLNRYQTFLGILHCSKARDIFHLEANLGSPVWKGIQRQAIDSETAPAFAFRTPKLRPSYTNVK